MLTSKNARTYPSELLNLPQTLLDHGGVVVGEEAVEFCNRKLCETFRYPIILQVLTGDVVDLDAVANTRFGVEAYKSR